MASRLCGQRERSRRTKRRRNEWRKRSEGETGISTGSNNSRGMLQLMAAPSHLNIGQTFPSLNINLRHKPLWLTGGYLVLLMPTKVLGPLGDSKIGRLAVSFP